MKRGFDGLSRAYASGELPKRSRETIDFVEWICPQAGDQALDAASGPATIARVLAGRVRRVFALDLSHSMLTEARRAETRGLEAPPANLFLTSGDVQHLPFPDAGFDLLTCAYALANLPELPAVIHECARVVARFGRIAFMEVIAPEDPSQCDHLNRLEAMRSDFYTRIRTYSECLDLFRNGGLALQAAEFHEGRQRLGDWLQLSPALDHRDPSGELCESVVSLARKAGLRPEGEGREAEFRYQTAWFLLRRE